MGKENNQSSNTNFNADKKEKENKNCIKDNNYNIKKIILEVSIVLIITLILTLIIIIIIKEIKNKELKKGSPIKYDINYEEAKSLFNPEIIDNNDYLISNVLNNINNSIIFCENTNISEMNSKIKYNSPDFLKNPEKSELKIIKNDLDFYKDKYEEMSKNINHLKNLSIVFLENLSYVMFNLENEISKATNQYENIIRKISIPLFYEKKIFKNIRVLSANDQNNEDKLYLFTKIEEYKNESIKLINIYNNMFQFLDESIQTISAEIEEFPNSIIELQNKVEEGMLNFEEINNNFMDPDNIEMFHENLKIIKNNFMSIKKELTKKQYRIENNIKENSYIIERIKIIENKKDETNEILKNLKIQSDSIIKDIIEEAKKKYLQSIQIPELDVSNIIFDLIDISLNNSIKSITEEISVIYDEFGNFQSIINVEEKTSLDLIIILDVTSSMAPYLDQVKLNLLNIINRITLKCPGIDQNIGFIGFRDITHPVSYDDIEFTQNYEDLKKSINNVKTSTGNDGSEEDIEEGFEMALKKNWRSNARIAILATDFPCHGQKYHSPKMGGEVFFPNGNPDRRNIEILVKELADKNISLFCMKITEYTDIMFEIFRTIYNDYENVEFKVVPLKSKEQLSNIIVESSSEVYINQRNI